MNRADEQSNRAMRGAYLTGRRARLAGRLRDTVPYKDYRTGRGAITWSRTFRKRWLDGWEDADSEFAETPGELEVDWVRIEPGNYRARSRYFDLVVVRVEDGPPGWEWRVHHKSLGLQVSRTVQFRGSELTLHEAKAKAEACVWRQARP